MRLTSLGFALSLSAFLLTGCSLTTTASPGSSTGIGLTGQVHGGQQPIVGSRVYLLEASATAYAGNGVTATTGNASHGILTSDTGNAVDPVLGSYVLTDPGGFFNISGDYQCDTGTQVYVYVAGGDSGTGTANSAITLLAALGECPTEKTFNVSSSTNYVPFIWVNEVTTVAAGYAFAGFASDATHVGAPSSDTAHHPLAQTGIHNAFANAASLADISGGTANSTVPGNSNSIVPQETINTLANILASCVNTNGPGSPSCSSLFSIATSDSTPTGTQPADTATALINIAHFPGADPGDLCDLQSGVSAPFQPDITCDSSNDIPNDFTMPIAFTDSSLFNVLTSVAIDNSGNAWVAALDTFAGDNLITKVSPTGQNLSAAGSPFNEPVDASDPSTPPDPQAIALDISGNAWMGNRGNLSNGTGSVSVLPTPNNYTGGGLQNVGAIAVDGEGFIWAGNEAGGPTHFGSVSVLYGSNASGLGHTQGDFVSGTPFTSGGISAVDGIAVDGLGYVWIADGSGAGGVSAVYGSNAPGGTGTSVGDGLTGSPFATSDLFGPSALAVDQNGFVWVVDPSMSPSPVAQLYGTNASGGHNPGDLFAPVYQPESLTSPSAIAIDGANNVWIANVSSANVTELYGSSASAGHSPGDPISPINESFGGGYTGSNGTPDSLFLEGPTGVAVDPSGNVWVADNEQLVVFIGIATPVATPLAANLTTPYNQTASKP